MSKSKRNRNTPIPVFISKLLGMLEDQACREWIQWLEQDNAQFTQKVLSKYFKHQNYSSFIRQVNMYDFTKIKHKWSQNAYSHQYFKKNDKQKLKYIKRKIAPEKIEESLVDSSKKSKYSDKQYNSILRRNQILEQTCKKYRQRIFQLEKQNDNLQKQKKLELQEKDTKLQNLILALIFAKKKCNLKEYLQNDKQFKRQDEDFTEMQINEKNEIYKKFIQDFKNKNNIDKIYNYLYKNTKEKQYKQQQIVEKKTSKKLVNLQFEDNEQILKSRERFFNILQQKDLFFRQNPQWNQQHEKQQIQNQKILFSIQDILNDD